MSVFLGFLAACAWAFVGFTALSVPLVSWLVRTPAWRRESLRRGMDPESTAARFSVPAQTWPAVRRVFVPAAYLVAYHSGAIAEVLR